MGADAASFLAALLAAANVVAALSSALAFHGLLVTGITFHIVDLGAEAGLSQPEVLALFIPPSWRLFG